MIGQTWNKKLCSKKLLCIKRLNDLVMKYIRKVIDASIQFTRYDRHFNNKGSLIMKTNMTCMQRNVITT